MENLDSELRLIIKRLRRASGTRAANIRLLVRGFPQQLHFWSAFYVASRPTTSRHHSLQSIRSKPNRPHMLQKDVVEQKLNMQHPSTIGLLSTIESKTKSQTRKLQNSSLYVDSARSTDQKQALAVCDCRNLSNAIRMPVCEDDRHSSN